MVDPDTFLTTLYVMVDDFCKTSLTPEKGPGPKASLTRSEVVTLAIFGQWSAFDGERGFYRYAMHRLKAAFPTLPYRGQFNRLVRCNYEAILAFFLHLVDLMGARHSVYEALDCSGVRTRDAKRRGAGWLPGQADIGWSNRLGWYEGFYLLTSVNPQGVITGFSFAPASAKDQPMAEDFFAFRHQPHPRLQSVGLPALGEYFVDKGFEGESNHNRWYLEYGARVLCPPKRNSKHSWPKRLRRWHAGLRQIVETVFDKLHNAFGLSRERPHQLAGFQVRLAAKMSLHNFCIWLNVHLGRPPLAFADLLDW